jgi:FAD:protein FMN transferase
MALVNTASDANKRTTVERGLSHVGVTLKALGGKCEIQAYIPEKEDPKKILNSVIAEIHRIQKKYSRFDSDSYLCKLNKQAYKGTFRIDEETNALLSFADACYVESEGRFDVTAGVLKRIWNFSTNNNTKCLPTNKEVHELMKHVGWDKVNLRNFCISFSTPHVEIDLGGIGKEYAADRAAIILKKNNIQHGFINLAGDIAVIGPKANGSPWRIGIKNPQISEEKQTSECSKVILLTSGGVATSGTYERFTKIGDALYSHIINAKTGWPVQEKDLSITVEHKSCLLAGAVATIAILLEEKRSDYLATKQLSGVRWYC